MSKKGKSVKSLHGAAASAQHGHTVNPMAGQASARQLAGVTLDDILSADLMHSFEKALEGALESRRLSFVHAIVDRLATLSGTQQQLEATPQNSSSWMPIESLSALRNLVGGRFHNLKAKWVEAGLPLREHRGDKGKDFEVDKVGWIELTNWISKQGFEVRLTEERIDCLFELRNIGKAE